ncbi:MAG: alanine racemase [Spirochaetaceae bacterium]|jgi:alanine racemase|nr:alanine racemase [Spirochaetaceae bacterium]
MRPTKAIIHLDKLKHNISLVRQMVGTRKVCMPVKADAYGHGMLAVAEAALEAGVAYLAIATVEEGAALRAAGISAPVLLLGYCRGSDIEAAIENRLELFAGDAGYLEEIEKAAAKVGKTAKIHIKIDTGMGRLGCRPEDAAFLAELLVSRPGLQLAGVSTHLAVSDSLDEKDIAWTNLQLDRFEKALSEIRQKGIEPGIVHAANSGGVCFHPRSHYDMVRPGIMLYGYPPEEFLATNDTNDTNILKEFLPVMELVTAIITTKQVKAGESVSYGRTWVASSDTTIGVLPLGYGDGLRRGLSGKLKVLIEGRLYEQVGRICMDQCMINLPSPNPSQREGRNCFDLSHGEGGDCICSSPSGGGWVGVTVSIFGGAGGMDAADLAALIGTIPYEITCGITARVPREAV